MQSHFFNPKALFSDPNDVEKLITKLTRLRPTLKHYEGCPPTEFSERDVEIVCAEIDMVIGQAVFSFSHPCQFLDGHIVAVHLNRSARTIEGQRTVGRGAPYYKARGVGYCTYIKQLVCTLRPHEVKEIELSPRGLAAEIGSEYFSGLSTGALTTSTFRQKLYDDFRYERIPMASQPAPHGLDAVSRLILRGGGTLRKLTRATDEFFHAREDDWITHFVAASALGIGHSALRKWAQRREHLFQGLGAHARLTKRLVNQFIDARYQLHNFQQ